MKRITKKMVSKYLSIKDRDEWWKATCGYEHPDTPCFNCIHSGKEVYAGDHSITCNLALQRLRG